MISHICLLVELGPICNSMAASLCLKICEDHSLLKFYNGGLWKNNHLVALPFDLGTLIHDHHANSFHIFMLHDGHIESQLLFTNGGFDPKPSNSTRNGCFKCVR